MAIVVKPQSINQIFTVEEEALRQHKAQMEQMIEQRRFMQTTSSFIRNKSKMGRNAVTAVNDKMQ